LKQAGHAVIRIIVFDALETPRPYSGHLGVVICSVPSLLWSY